MGQQQTAAQAPFIGDKQTVTGKYIGKFDVFHILCIN